MSVSTVKWIGDGSTIGGLEAHSDSEEELSSDEVSLTLRLLFSLRLRDLDLRLPLPLLEDLLDDLLLDDPRTEDRSFLPVMDAGDFGGRWFGAIDFGFFGGREGVEDSALLGALIVILAKLIVAYCFLSSWDDKFD